jgi:uncharacterized membrane protein YbhN (UPF0104 family)
MRSAAQADIVAVDGSPPAPRRKTLAQRVNTALPVVVLALAAWFLARELRGIEWREVTRALASIPARGIGAALLVAAASYGTLSLFDYLAIRHFALPLTYPRTLVNSFIVYAFNFTLGSLIGAVGMRFRLYAKAGLPAGDIGRVTVYAAATAWTGYALFGGLVLTLGAPAVPDGPPLALPWLATFRPLGIVLLVIGVAYLLLCHHRDEPLRVRHWRYELPEARDAALQIAVASVQWALVSLVVFLLLPAGTGVGYADILAVHLVAALAGVLTHVPAGLGVLEGTFVLMLGERLPKDVLLGTLIAFRALYYLLPFLLAAVLLAALELRDGRTREADAR